VKKSKKDWRDEPVPRGDFQCACGCELQLSRGDLADAVRSALAFDGNPRTWGVTYTTFAAPLESKRDADDLVEKQLCSGCRHAVVELPAFAVELLKTRGADWPKCATCRARTQGS
jgi:hypothetical protein